MSAKSKTVRKRAPTKMTSDAIREFYSFILRKQKHKQRKQNMDVECNKAETTVVDLSSQAQNVASVHEDSMAGRNHLPSAEVVAGSHMQCPILLNVDSHGNPTQMPVVSPHTMPMPGGAQPALVFFVGSPSMPVTGELPVVSNVSRSTAPFANALFLTQPVTLNVVPQDAQSGGGVIEKAMELANFQTISGQCDSQQPSQSSTDLTNSEAGFIPPNASCPLQPGSSQGTMSTDHSIPCSTLPQVSQNVVIAQSVAAGENIPIDNVSQSVTVQTSQVMQNQVFADLRSFIEESRAEVTGTEIASTAETDSFEEQSPRRIYKRKGIGVREVVTQTKGDPEVLILSERKLDYGEDSSEDPVDDADTQKTVKKPGTERVRRFGCDKCDKKFFTSNDLKRHQTSHQDSRPFICEECQKGFRTSSELGIHKAIHVQVKQYKCEFCGKEFRTKGCIKSHIKYHIGDKRHKCTECDRAFVKSADLKRHMAGHKNEKKFVCDDCGSAFTRRDNLKAHRLLHTRDSVVTCDLCSKEFINAVYLKRHMHIHEQAKKKPYECQWCPKTYEQLEGLRRHIRQHVGDEKFVCKDCGKKFITSIQLKRHLWLSHDQDSPYRRSIL